MAVVVPELKIKQTATLHNLVELILAVVAAAAKTTIPETVALALKPKCGDLDQAVLTVKVLMVGQVLLLFDTNQN